MSTTAATQARVWDNKTEAEMGEMEKREDRKLRLAVGKMILENVIKVIDCLNDLKAERKALRERYRLETDPEARARLEAEIEAKGAEMDELCRGSDQYSKAAREWAGKREAER